MADYTTDAAEALVTIKEAGGQAVIKRFTRVLDPVLGTTDISAKQSGVLDLIKLPLRRGEVLDNGLLEAFVTGRLSKMLVAASSAPFCPTALDIVLFAGGYWLVRSCTELNPTGATPILYYIVVENTDLSQQDIEAMEITELEAAIARLDEEVDLCVHLAISLHRLHASGRVQ